jgi:hypothetical protein
MEKFVDILSLMGLILGISATVIQVVDIARSSIAEVSATRYKGWPLVAALISTAWLLSRC